MYEFWYNYVQPKNGENAKICYMDIDSFIVLVKTVDFCEDTTEDVETMNQTDRCLKEKQLKSNSTNER